MEMVTVKSSNLKEVGYNKETSKLRITFTNGKSYTYKGVPAEVHTELMGAKSVGSYFSSNIRNKYKYEVE